MAKRSNSDVMKRIVDYNDETIGRLAEKLEKGLDNCEVRYRHYRNVFLIGLDDEFVDRVEEEFGIKKNGIKQIFSDLSLIITIIASNEMPVVQIAKAFKISEKRATKIVGIVSKKYDVSKVKTDQAIAKKIVGPVFVNFAGALLKLKTEVGDEKKKKYLSILEGELRITGDDTGKEKPVYFKMTQADLEFFARLEDFKIKRRDVRRDNQAAVIRGDFWRRWFGAGVGSIGVRGNRRQQRGDHDKINVNSPIHAPWRSFDL